MCGGGGGGGELKSPFFCFFERLKIRIEGAVCGDGVGKAAHLATGGSAISPRMLPCQSIVH